MNFGSIPAEGFIRPADFAFVLGISRPSLYRRIQQGEIPPPQKYGRISRWSVDVVRKVIAEQGGYILPSVDQGNQPISAS